MSLPRWHPTVYLRGDDARRTAELVGFTSLKLEQRFQGVDGWQLTASGLPALESFTLGALRGLEVAVDGMVVMSGPATNVRRERSSEGTTVVLTGVGDEVLLGSRLASPDPADPAPPYDTQAHDVRTGPASTVMWQLVQANLGPTAVGARRVGALTLAPDPGVGPVVTYRARWKPLSEVLAFLGNLGSTPIGWQVTADGAGQLVFSVAESRDRTTDVHFALELGSVAKATTNRRRPETTHAVVGGSGAGTARTIIEVDGGATRATYGRLERFRDSRNTADPAELTAAGNDLLSRATAPEVTLDVTGDGYVPGVDYALGDLVSVAADGGTLAQVIRSLRWEWDAAGVAVRPTVGPPGTHSPDVPHSVTATQGVAARVAALEEVA